MPKMQVYLPDSLYQRLKQHPKRLNVSSVLQAALEDVLGEIERQEALGRALESYEREHGRFSEKELTAVEKRDQGRRRRVTKGVTVHHRRSPAA